MAMGADQYHRWDELAASALEWWADAGVDVLVNDDARDWLARPAPVAVASPAPAAAPVGAGPADYANFWESRSRVSSKRSFASAPLRRKEAGATRSCRPRGRTTPTF